jgi:catechol 2,3-dioxygenase-like lactoylglutathione lyase family enzyme
VTLALVSTLFHVAIKTQDIDASRRFYVNVLGMTLDVRPATDFPGLWLRSPLPRSAAIFHIYAGEAALEPDGSLSSGAGVIDHVSIAARGYVEFRERFREYRLRWRESLVPGRGLWQLFVYDPSGVLLELTFEAEAEQMDEPRVAPELQYKPRENFFRPQDYTQFAHK